MIPLRRLSIALALAVFAAAPARAVWNPPRWQVSPPAMTTVHGPAATTLLWLLDGYRATVSRVDGNRCPSYPTCSAYAREALSGYGPVVGTVLTAARLLGESDQAAFSPRIFVGGKWRVYAPLEDDLAFRRGPLEP